MSIIDEQPNLIVRVAERGMFAPGNPDGEAFAEVTNESAYAALLLEGRAARSGSVGPGVVGAGGEFLTDVKGFEERLWT